MPFFSKLVKNPSGHSYSLDGKKFEVGIQSASHTKVPVILHRSPNTCSRSIDVLLQKEVVQQDSPLLGQFLSNIFLVLKKGGERCLALNLKKLKNSISTIQDGGLSCSEGFSPAQEFHGENRSHYTSHRYFLSTSGKSILRILQPFQCVWPWVHVNSQNSNQ